MCRRQEMRQPLHPRARHARQRTKAALAFSSSAATSGPPPAAAVSAARAASPFLARSLAAAASVARNWRRKGGEKEWEEATAM